jgi:hypothetical protein
MLNPPEDGHGSSRCSELRLDGSIAVLSSRFFERSRAIEFNLLISVSESMWCNSSLAPVMDRRHDLLDAIFSEYSDSDDAIPCKLS